MYSPSTPVPELPPAPLRLRIHLGLIQFLSKIRIGFGLRMLRKTPVPCQDGGPYLYTSPRGFHLEFNPRWYVDVLVATDLLRAETLSDGLLARLAKLIRPGDWVIDLGANVGGITLELARLCSAGGKVIAYEPNPPVFHAFCRNVQRNGFADKVVPVMKGAFYEPCVKTLFMPAHWNLGTASIYDEASNAGGTALNIELERVDDLWARLGKPPVRFMKLDIQGAEVDALRGMPEILRLHRPHIISEFSAATGEALSLTLRDLANALAPHHYTHVQLIGRPTPPITLAQAQSDAYLHTQGNALFYAVDTP